MHRGRLRSRVWLLPEPWPETKPNLEVTRHAPCLKTSYIPLSALLPGMMWSMVRLREGKDIRQPWHFALELAEKGVLLWVR